MIKLPKLNIKTMTKKLNGSALNRICLMVVSCSFILVSLGTTAAQAASSYTQQIESLEQQNSQAQSQLSGLQGQAATYQAELDQLNAQINGLEAQISTTESSIATIQAQIQADQVELAQEKQTLGDIIKTMYEGGNISTLEMLATSKNISAFVTKEEYQNIVQSQIQNTLAQIKQTEATLNQQNTQLNATLLGQKAMDSQLDASEAQQAQLMSYNQAQQDNYNAQLSANNAKLSTLEEEQAAANAAEAGRVTPAFGNGSGACSIGQGTGPVSGPGIIAANYPNSWCNDGLDEGTDSNGILVRECTSFAEWYFVDVEGNTNFSASGNAGWWWETTNYPVSTTPAVGDIGVEPSSATSTAAVPSYHNSPTGHVMIVVALQGQSYDGIPPSAGDVIVASMNEDEEGHFMYNYWPASDLWYIQNKAN
jgi:peptidoglycan hydrolase CwlO-like protein